MTESLTFYARRVNHGQSEIWIETDGKELTQRRTLATNEVLNVTRRHCVPEVFEAFCIEYSAAIGRVATLAGNNVDAVSAELRLKA